MLLPLVFSNKTTPGGALVLAGDVGATKTNLALFRVSDHHQTVLKEIKFKSQQYESFTVILDEFLKELPMPESICIGVAGPVVNDKVIFTNLSWSLSSDEIAEHSGIDDVYLINDLEATAYGLAMLEDEDVLSIHRAEEISAGNAAIIAPGTGLGEAGLFFDGQVYHPFATEGGHCDFAPRNQSDAELGEYLQKKFKHVSWERLICGPGILNIYQFLRDEKRGDEPSWLAEKISNGDAAAVISQYVNQSELCKETMQLFIHYLAYESANLVLKLKATGGLFIGGGIAPQVIPLFKEFNFVEYFISSGRMNYLLEKVPVKLVLNNRTALLGAAYYGTKHSIIKQEVND